MLTAIPSYHSEQSGAISLLYDRLPLVCKQCAQRFPDDAAGKKRMQDHLDLHFRQNRKASQNTGRGHSRSWFVGIEVSQSSLPLIFFKALIDANAS